MVCSVRRRNVTIFTMPSQEASVALRRASRRGFVGKSRSPLDGSSIASRQRPKLRLMLSQRAAYVGVCLSVATLSGLLGHDQPRQPLFGLCDAAMGGHISLSRLWLDCFGGVGRLGAGARRGETARHSTPALAANRVFSRLRLERALGTRRKHHSRRQIAVLSTAWTDQFFTRRRLDQISSGFDAHT